MIMNVIIHINIIEQSTSLCIILHFMDNSSATYCMIFSIILHNLIYRTTNFWVHH